MIKGPEKSKIAADISMLTSKENVESLFPKCKPIYKWLYFSGNKLFHKPR